ncbi:MAG: glycosyltransferase family 39 protein [Oscillospiraceae bacterium]
MCYDAYMNYGLEENKISRRELLLLLLTLALGFAVRLLFLASLPLGLNQDEASAGYDAWAILSSGADRCGAALPVLLTAWGSGQNALYSYLSMPFIALFGLSVFSLRLVAALSGCAALVLFWLLARRTRGPAFALAALLLLAVNPWHIMASRWALESNLLPTFLLGGIYFTARAREREWSLLPAAVFFGLSLYAYGTAYFFLPPFLVFAVLLLRKRLRPASFLVSLGAFLLIALPISLCQLRNALGLPATAFLGFTLPALTQTRQAATSVLGGGGLSAALGNFGDLLGILIKQSDGLPYNSAVTGGMFYFFGLPLAVVGLIKSARSLRDAPEEAFVLAALGCSLLCAFFIDGNINRLNMVWLPLLYFMALGLYVILCKLKKFSAIPLAAVFACFVLFAFGYWRDFKAEGSAYYYPGLGEALQYVEQQSAESVFVSYYVNQPYIFALFYSETPPQEFISTVDYMNPDGAFRWVRSFGKYRFGNAEDAEGEYLILHRSERGARDVLAEFGQFVVCPG